MSMLRRFKAALDWLFMETVPICGLVVVHVEGSENVIDADEVNATMHAHAMMASLPSKAAETLALRNAGPCEGPPVAVIPCNVLDRRDAGLTCDACDQPIGSAAFDAWVEPDVFGPIVVTHRVCPSDRVRRAAKAEHEPECVGVGIGGAK